jgi:hypothetical protein
MFNILAPLWIVSLAAPPVPAESAAPRKAMPVLPTARVSASASGEAALRVGLGVRAAAGPSTDALFTPAIEVSTKNGSAVLASGGAKQDRIPRRPLKATATLSFLGTDLGELDDAFRDASDEASNAASATAQKSCQRQCVDDPASVYCKQLVAQRLELVNRWAAAEGSKAKGKASGAGEVAETAVVAPSDGDFGEVHAASLGLLEKELERSVDRELRAGARLEVVRGRLETAQTRAKQTVLADEYQRIHRDVHDVWRARVALQDALVYCRTNDCSDYAEPDIPLCEVGLFKEQEVERAWRPVGATQNYWLVSLGGAVGLNRFEYYDRDNPGDALSIRRPQRVAWSAVVSGARLFPVRKPTQKSPGATAPEKAWLRQPAPIFEAYSSVVGGYSASDRQVRWCGDEGLLDDPDREETLEAQECKTGVLKAPGRSIDVSAGVFGGVAGDQRLWWKVLVGPALTYHSAKPSFDLALAAPVQFFLAKAALPRYEGDYDGSIRLIPSAGYSLPVAGSDAERGTYFLVTVELRAQRTFFNEAHDW